MISALDYWRLARKHHGPIPRRVNYGYIWGDALIELRREHPQVRLINLETAITTSGDWQPKGINYRMHPDNTNCLRAAGIQCCSLANNHVLDWGAAGLRETLAVLRRNGIDSVGAGMDAQSAAAPAIMPLDTQRRVLVFSAGMPSSGIPSTWAAGAHRLGVNVLTDLSDDRVWAIAAQIGVVRRPGDIVVFSVHWGGNWGYAVPATQRRFAQALIDVAAVDVVHGHSSHHCKGIEIYRGKPILYGCGDLINDYEGITDFDEYRADLCLLYFVRFSSERELLRFVMVPMQRYRFRLRYPDAAAVEWLYRRLQRECEPLNTRVARKHRTLHLVW